jgi:serine phosphatase RsbU (regulator of sigma subunit)
MIFLGTVPQPSPDASLGSRAALSLLADSLTGLNLASDSKETLKSAAQAIEQTARLVFRMFDGQLALALASIHFDYQSGKGSIACFGHPAPYLVSPDERKPLSISTPGLDEGLIGLTPEVTVRFTEFTVMPGQFLAACTIGVLSIRDSERKSFEKEILRGRLSMLDPAVLRSSAGEIAEAIIDEAEKQNSSSILTEDLTVVCLTPSDTFPS